MIQRTGLQDTLPEAEQVQIECYRKMTVAHRMEMTRALTRAAFSASIQAIRKSRPELSDLEQRLLLMELNYGSELAAKVRERLLTDGY